METTPKPKTRQIIEPPLNPAEHILALTPDKQADFIDPVEMVLGHIDAEAFAEYDTEHIEEMRFAMKNITQS
jgi:hypothetical protein